MKNGRCVRNDGNNWMAADELFLHIAKAQLGRRRIVDIELCEWRRAFPPI